MVCALNLVHVAQLIMMHLLLSELYVAPVQGAKTYLVSAFLSGRVTGYHYPRARRAPYPRAQPRPSPELGLAGDQIYTSHSVHLIT
jgi:hypothetical protein